MQDVWHEFWTAAIGVTLGLLVGVPATGASLTAIDVGSGLDGDGSRHAAYTRVNGGPADLSTSVPDESCSTVPANSRS